jgi:hypothetical protein
MCPIAKNVSNIQEEKKLGMTVGRWIGVDVDGNIFLMIA